MKKPTIAVLIPCYNESQTIAKVINDYREVLPEANIYVYDNNSKDNTAEIAHQGGQLLRMNGGRVKVMLFVVCLGILKPMRI